MRRVLLATATALALGGCADRDASDTFRAVAGTTSDTVLTIACLDAAGDVIYANGAEWAARHGLWADIALTTAWVFRSAYCDAKGLTPVPMEQVPASPKLDDGVGHAIRRADDLAMQEAVRQLGQ